MTTGTYDVPPIRPRLHLGMTVPAQRHESALQGVRLAAVLTRAGGNGRHAGVTCLSTRGNDMPVCDGLMAADGPGRFFAQHPAVYWLSLAGSSGASIYALMRLGSPGGGRRLPWAAMAVVEAGITVGMIRAKNSADGGPTLPAGLVWLRHRIAADTP